jgi:hypothetical protein
MTQQRLTARQIVMWGSLCAAAMAGVVALSLSSGRTSGQAAPAEAAQAPAPAPAQAAPEATSATPAATSPSAAGAWAQYRPASGLVVRAEDEVELRGLMTLEQCPDNKGVLTAAGEPATVKYVWCKDDGHTKAEAGEASRTPPQEHSAVFELSVPETRTYFPWARVWWEDGCGNSMFVVLEREGQKAQEFVVEDGTFQFWHWLPVAGETGLPLEKGTYRLVVKNREDGARLSRILFCTRSYAVYKPETSEG